MCKCDLLAYLLTHVVAVRTLHCDVNLVSSEQQIGVATTPRELTALNCMYCIESRSNKLNDSALSIMANYISVMTKLAMEQAQ